MHDMQNLAHFLCSLLLRRSLQNVILDLTSPYLVLIQVPGNPNCETASGRGCSALWRGNSVCKSDISGISDFSVGWSGVCG